MTKGTNLTRASNEWATRPADERYWSLDELKSALIAEYNDSTPASCKSSELRVEAHDGDLILAGKNLKAGLTNWSFGQLCSRAGANDARSYLSRLPATLAAQNINHGLKNDDDDNVAKLLLRRDAEGYVTRAITSKRYTRIHDLQITNHLLNLRDDGWRTPPARPAHGIEGLPTRIATAEDVMTRGGMGGLSVKVGDLISPAGIYRGDRDMFIFMVNESRRINDGTEEGLARGFFVGNSEVGARSFWILTFLYRFVCGNHIVWGAQGVHELRLRHVGRALERSRHELTVALKKYADASATDTEQKIARARTFRIAASKADVIDEIFNKRIATRSTVSDAIDVTETHPEDGDPLSAWGLAQGLTRNAQVTMNADARVEAERAAGKVLELAF